MAGAIDGYQVRVREHNQVSCLKWDGCDSNQRCELVAADPDGKRRIEMTMILEEGVSSTVRLWWFRNVGGGVGAT